MKSKALTLILIAGLFLFSSGQAFGKEFVLVLDLDAERAIFSSGDPGILNEPISLGSTIKPFLAIAALNHGYRAETKVLCPSLPIQTPQEERCWLAGGHGRLGLSEALGRSCSVYFRSMIRSQDKSNLLDTLSDYHLIDDRHADSTQRLSREDLLGTTDRLKIRPGRMLGAYCGAFAKKDLLDIDAKNGKIRIRPRGRAPDCSGIETVMEGLRAGALRGTFADAQNACPAVSVFGKTGTAGVEGDSNGRRRGLFIGFSPYPKPGYCVLVLVEPGTGGRDAALLGIGQLCRISGHSAPESK